jgi:inner membrane protein
MDSLTHIVLGAACGKIVLGKKIGNKALLFGAIGGTIKDLDVFIGKLLYTNKMQAMAFHRGFMHSLLCAVLATFVFG